MHINSVVVVVFYRKWMENSICSVIHLLDNLLHDFIGKYNLVCTNRRYNTVIKAVPQAMILILDKNPTTLVLLQFVSNRP